MNAKSPVVLYLHIPKAGGTTLSKWMFAQARNAALDSETKWLRNGVFYYPSGFVAEPSETELAQARQVLPMPNLQAVFGHFHFGIHKAIRQPWAYVTMLRHPVDRVLSLYNFQRLVEQRWGSHHGIVLPETMDLEAFVTKPPYPEIDNGQTRRIAGLHPPVGQCDALLLDTARQHLQQAFSVVGLTERFDEMILLLCRAFGWSSTELYYPNNVNTAQDSKPLPRHLRELIEQTQALDMDLYHFAAELVQKEIDRAGPSFDSELADFEARKQTWYEEVGGWDMPSRLR